VAALPHQREALRVLGGHSRAAFSISAIVYVLRAAVAILELHAPTLPSIAAELVVAAMWFAVPAAILLGAMVTVAVLKRHAQQNPAGAIRRSRSGQPA
jgi:hypothetical protein